MDCLDLNIWIYGLVPSENDPKRLRAIELIKSKRIGVSLQVVNEVCRVLLQKGKVSEAFLRSVIRGFYSRFTIVQIEEVDITYASRLRERYHLSFWDSLHIAMALKVGTSTFYSEDMHDGLVIEGTLTIQNPFK